MMSSYSHDFVSHIKSLQDPILGTPPYCSGALPVQPNDLIIYYGKGENVRQLNLHRPSTTSLEHLVKTCEPASYDESYRKAGRLNSDSFRPMLDVHAVGIVNVVRERLLGGPEDKLIRAELYNLNVNGEGSFFKAHVDTPRGEGENMFGSLVIFYPIPHEGGALVLRKGGKEWSFDSSQVLADGQQPQVGYVALHRDVEHEVLPITSGHRISITYNLYFDCSVSMSLPTPLSSLSMASTFRTTLEKLLGDPNFLPPGAHLGFALKYHYPGHTSAGCSLGRLKGYLKGVDADINKACEELGLETSLWTIINESDGHNLLACEGIVPKYEDELFDGEDDRSLDEWLRQNFNAKFLKTNFGNKATDIHVVWVKPLSEEPEDRWDKQVFVGDGEYTYAHHTVCLLVGKGERNV